VIHDDLAGWVSIFLGALIVTYVTSKLTRARRSGTRLYAPSLWAWWSGCFISAALTVEGALLLRDGGIRPAWIAVFVVIANIVALLVPGIVFRVKAGLPWTLSRSTDTATDGGASTLGPAIELDTGTTELIRRIKAAQFSTTRLSPGYDEEEVDIFLDNLIAVLGEGGRLDQSKLRDVRFATTRLRPGYVIQDVHSFLDEVARQSW
jgi:DivIVA domain-containing protein